jgi:hypothetical protein
MDKIKLEDIIKEKGINATEQAVDAWMPCQWNPCIHLPKSQII